MDKRLLQTYSVWAKENLEKQIEVSLKTLGINSDQDIKRAKKVGDYTVIEGDSNSYPADLLFKRDQIVGMVKEKGYKNVIEEFAYTWFNRFVALRFMEVHDFLPHGFRVLSNRSGSVEPEILKNLNFVKNELSLDMAYCSTLKEQGKTEELFRYVLLHQCNVLADILPMLFTKESDHLELLLPKSLLIGDTVITKLVEIPEDNFLEDVEAIGWLYQFYVADKRQQYRDAKLVTKELIPTLTQVFTTDWIVRYMAENSVGRIWMESYPQSSLRSTMKYYVDDPEQTVEVQRQLDTIKYKNVNPEDIRVIEPCCGSGHILVYVFDLLYRMYEEKGYQKRDIPTLILTKNLYGLEIDKRASQLASFSLVMKARTINPRFFNANYYVEPQVFEIYDSTHLMNLGYKHHMKEMGIFSSEEIKAVDDLVETFRNGKTVGSLLMIKSINYVAIENVVFKLEKKVVANIFNMVFISEGCALIKQLLQQAKVMSAKYDVMITNPPYLGISKMEVPPKEYLTINYPDSKSDMFAMFMEAPYVKKNGLRAIVNPDSWMFLVSYEGLREKIIRSKFLLSMIHLGLGAFDATVQTTAHVFRESSINMIGKYYRLVSSDDKEAEFLNNAHIFIYPIRKFIEIPSNEFVYWLPSKVVEAFKLDTIGKNAVSDGQTKTGNNDKYLRLIWEVDKNKTGKGEKWVKHAKGGVFRKWYGNIDTFIDWSEKARKHYREDHVARIAPEYIWFREGICWNLITSSPKFAARILTEDSTFNLAAPSIFLEGHEQTLFTLGLLNTKVGETIIRALNPTLNTNIGDIMNQPLISPRLEIRERVLKIVNECMQLSKTDWDSFETSWEFHRHPLIFDLKLKEEYRNSQWEADRIEKCSSLKWLYQGWESECRNRFNTLKANEEELNRIFIGIYGLQDELTPEVEDKDVTVRLADKERDVKSLISYLIGIIMGRYSLDVNGLAYAGGNWDASKYIAYQPDDDGIVPIYTTLGMEDSLTSRVIELIKLIYGADYYRQNIDFIAEALGKNNNESSEETLNRYLNDGFYADHLKIYQKRPIYWMFSSGKYSGFKCLVYMHRYTEDTLALINGKYFLPESTRLKNDMEDLNNRINSAEGRDKIRLEKERQKLAASYNEAIEYGQVLDHMANKYIAIDLDDGVKVNYAKFQGVELVTDSGTKVKKDLLVPIK